MIQYRDTTHTPCCTVAGFFPDNGHPEIPNGELKSQGSASRNVYPLLMIAGLIMLRALQHEEGNLGSASRSRTTAAPRSRLEGADLKNLSRPLLGGGSSDCVRMCI